MEEHRTPELLTPLESKTKNYTWLYILIIIVLGGLNVYQFLNDGKSSEKKADAHQVQAKIHSDSAKVSFEQSKGHIVKDSALEKAYDSVLNIKSQITKQNYEKYKVINKYGVSDFQSHFDSLAADWTSKRNKSGNPRQH